ncbi:uncharacterized protein LOC103967290 isoform X2 [Pyrus x bretschneideri]|uniref:uncharacterized protein LOC103967290 isoform X2 n=1 Tax=Pyrus x bretschneideri TaxID=225117 RepID=UPI00202FC265|nr:uncharacterized protein LOC103967290 isoform X2 [Pyrus x bretschneideri]
MRLTERRRDRGGGRERSQHASSFRSDPGHFSLWGSLRVYVYLAKHRRPCLSGCIYATIMDEVDVKIVVAGISTTCSQKIHNQLLP